MLNRPGRGKVRGWGRAGQPRLPASGGQLDHGVVGDMAPAGVRRNVAGRTAFND